MVEVMKIMLTSFKRSHACIINLKSQHTRQTLDSYIKGQRRHRHTLSIKWNEKNFLTIKAMGTITKEYIRFDAF